MRVSWQLVVSGTCGKEAPAWLMRARRELPLPNDSGWLRTHRVACCFVKQSNRADQHGERT
jgi:hypothetical protein